MSENPFATVRTRATVTVAIRVVKNYSGKIEKEELEHQAIEPEKRKENIPSMYSYISNEKQA